MIVTDNEMVDFPFEEKSMNDECSYSSDDDVNVNLCTTQSSTTTYNSVEPVSTPTVINDTEFTLSKKSINILINAWKHHTKNPIANRYISTSFDLDFSPVPRPEIRPRGEPSNNEEYIPIHNSKQACAGTKWHFCLQLAKCNYQTLSKKERLILAEAIGRRESYICGYKKPFAGRTIMR